MGGGYSCPWEHGGQNRPAWVVLQHPRELPRVGRCLCLPSLLHAPTLKDQEHREERERDEQDP